MEDIRITETSGVGMLAILLWLISGCPFRLFGAKVWQTDKHRSDKLQCTGQDPKRIVTWNGNYVYRCANYTWFVSKSIGLGCKSATNYARYCNKSDESLRYNNSYISLHSENGMTAKRKMIEMMDMIGLCGVIYRT